jgi:hypothetical protein
VAKRQRATPFAEIVREVEATPSPDPPAARGAGFLAGNLIVDEAGTQFRCVHDEISPSRAVVLAIEGAQLVYDACGCQGGCGLDWYDESVVRELGAKEPPRVKRKRHGNLSEFRSGDGAALILAEDAVEWGDLLEGSDSAGVVLAARRG